MQHHFAPMASVSIRETRAEASYWSATLVLDFTEGKELRLGIPQERGAEVVYAPGTNVTLDVPLPDGLRRYTATVLGRSGPPPSLLLSCPVPVGRIQRRNNVRVPTTCRVELAVHNTAAAEVKTLGGMTADLSVGGARVLLAEDVAPGTQVEVTLHLPEVGDRTCLARVLRRGENVRAAPQYRYWTAMEFMALEERVRRDITRFVFDVQRDQIKKGLE